MMDTTATGSTRVEKAVFFLDKDLSLLEAFPREELPYERIYFGHESCDRRMPTSQQLARFLESMADTDVGLTLVTPVAVSEEGLARITELLETNLGRQMDEIVINDWGVLALVQTLQLEQRIVFGRWMNRCKRDPRVDGLGLESDLRADLSRGHYENEVYRTFLLGMGISRIEHDLLPHGVKICTRDDGLDQSLYVGVIPVALNRLCVPGATARSGRVRFDPDAPCRLECQRFSIRILGQNCEILGRAAYTAGGQLTPELIRSVDRIVQVIP